MSKVIKWQPDPIRVANSVNNMKSMSSGQILETEMVTSFIEPLAYLQYHAYLSGFEELHDALQECIDIIYKNEL